MLISLVDPERRQGRPRQMVLLFGALLLLGASGLFAAVEAIDAHHLGDQARLQGPARSLAAVVDTQLDAFAGALQTLAGSAALKDRAVFEAEARAAGAALGGWFLLLGPAPAHPVLMNTRAPPGASWPENAAVLRDPAFAAAVARVVAEGRPQLTDRFEGPLAQRPTIALMTPVDLPGEPRRILAMAFEPVVLQAALMAQPLPPGGFAAILDGRRSILASSAGTARDGAVADGALVIESLLGTRDGRGAAEHALVVEHPSRARGWSVVLGAPLAQQRAAMRNLLPWLVAGATLFGFGALLVMAVVRREALDAARAEATALREGRAEIERLHRGLPVILFVSEIDGNGRGRRLYLGGDVRAVSGWDAEGFDALVARRLMVPGASARLRGYYAEVLRLGSATAEFPLSRPDGSGGVLEVTARVLERQEGRALVVGCALDVTTRREAERRAADAARLASLGETAACLAHEVKQPLLAMSLAAELAAMALQRQDAPEAQRLLDGIVDRARRTAEMIDRLRRFARGAEEMAATDDVALDAVVADCLVLVGAALADAGVAVEQALGVPPPVVRGQAILIEQILANLLLNARDAMAARPASLPRRIRISAVRQSQGLVALEVADTGGGIAPEIMARLFEPFVSSKEAAQGTGLGLSVCRGLMRAMGGSIAAGNTPEGAAFTLVLRLSEVPSGAVRRDLAA